ncbi:MAG: hypothetical protein Q8N23_34210 [Archangium sp.]|nr:hypothetical protein [Archangium sp.]MDP3157775.1 hypothetical protein [Archangium sp.]MDP3571263.1 hypothetical protein [Archangium sp.]
MRPNDLYISTITLARSDQEAELLETSLKALALLQVPIAVSDGGSPKAVVDFLSRIPGVSLVSSMARGLVPQVKASVRAALTSGRKFILYTEPDKQRFFENGLVEFLRRAPDTDDVGLVIAARTEASLSTFPSLQQLTERAINQLTGQVVGQKGDYSYGPFVMHRKLAALVEQLPDSIGWGWRHALFALAQQDKFKVVLAQGDFSCPSAQRDEQAQDKDRRMKQLDQNIEGLLTAVKTPFHA